MQNLNDIKKEIDYVDNVRSFLRIYEEIAVIKMKKIRESVVNTRKFAEEMYPIFISVKGIYKKEVSKHTDDPNYIYSTVEKTGNALAVIVTPNERLVGDVGEKVFENYKNSSIYKNPHSLLIIGRTGKKIALAFGLGNKHKYFDFPDKTNPTSYEAILDTIIRFQQVQAFYPKFLSFIEQITVEDGLSGEMEEKYRKDDDSVKAHYIVEPSVESVLNFFEVEIFSTIFKQKLYECELAKYGSRINAMESAIASTETRLKRLKAERFIFLKRMDNKLQLERLSGVALWRKRL